MMNKLELALALVAIVCASLCSMTQAVENTRCTEYKKEVDADVLMGVPCVLIRLMETIKECPINSYFDTFLGMR